MKLSERIHNALAGRMLSKFHKTRTAQLKRWKTEATQLEAENERLHNLAFYEDDAGRGYCYKDMCEQLEAKLEAIECGDCEKSMLECECDE